VAGESAPARPADAFWSPFSTRPMLGRRA